MAEKSKACNSDVRVYSKTLVTDCVCVCARVPPVINQFAVTYDL